MRALVKWLLSSALVLSCQAVTYALSPANINLNITTAKRVEMEIPSDKDTISLRLIWTTTGELPTGYSGYHWDIEYLNENGKPVGTCLDTIRVNMKANCPAWLSVNSSGFGGKDSNENVLPHILNGIIRYQIKYSNDKTTNVPSAIAPTNAVMKDIAPGGLGYILIPYEQFACRGDNNNFYFDWVVNKDTTKMYANSWVDNGIDPTPEPSPPFEWTGIQAGRTFTDTIKLTVLSVADDTRYKDYLEKYKSTQFIQLQKPN